MSIYILYKTVRISTGEYYIGVHKVNTDKYPDFNDGYLGSGIIIGASIKKCGRKAFKRTLLAISEDSRTILGLEAQTVTREMITDPLCLNIAIGGRASVKGQSHSVETRQKMSGSRRGVKKGPQSTEHRQKIGDANRGVPKGPFSPERCQAISDRQQGVPKGPLSAETKQKLSDSRRGRTHSAETRQKIKDSMTRLRAAKLSLNTLDSFIS